MANSTASPNPFAEVMESIERAMTVISERVDAVSEEVAAVKAGIAALPGVASKPEWLTKAEAIEYTRIPAGTFKKLAGSGRIPSHGGKTKVFKRVELDRALDAL